MYALLSRDKPLGPGSVILGVLPRGWPLAAPVSMQPLSVINTVMKRIIFKAGAHFMCGSLVADFTVQLTNPFGQRMSLTHRWSFRLALFDLQRGRAGDCPGGSPRKAYEQASEIINAGRHSA